MNTIDEAKVTAAMKAFTEAVASPRKIYDVWETAAWRAYEETMDAAQRAYDEAVAPAREVYHAALKDASTPVDTAP